MLGQVFKRGPVEVFEMIKKKFSGIGWASVVISWIISVYYAIILCWSVFFFFQSFISPLPWSKEANLRQINLTYQFTNNTLNNNNSIYNTTVGMNNISTSDIEEDYVNLDYFPKVVLRISEGINDMGSVNGNLALCLLITYILIFICISKGIKSSSKVVYFTAPAPIILLLILFFK